MKRSKELWMQVAALAVAVAVFPEVATAQDESSAETPALHNVGPYGGLGAGYNQAGDQTLDFRGTHTSPTQPTVPVELPALKNTGIGAENEYKGAPGYSGVVGYKFNSGLRTEFEVAYRRSDADKINYPDPGPGPQSSPQTVKITATTGMFNLWYDLFPTSRFHPYIGGGGGFTRIKLNNQPTNQLSSGPYVVNLPLGPLVCPFQDCTGPRKSDDADFSYQGGAGIRFDVTDSITAGLDYRYLKTAGLKLYGFKDQQETHFDSKYDTQSLMLSLNYFFFQPAPTPAAAPAPAAVVAPVADADGDGVPDDLDQCPGTPAGTPVDDKGCPLPPPPPPCKTPEPGERVSLKGCGTGDTIVLRGVNFEFDKSRLTQNAKSILDGVSEELVANPGIQIELGGHTDSKGTDEYNQQLSEKRANTVVKYLTDKGVAGDRMTAAGYGEAQPVADNDTDEGRELNRRVELKVTGSSAPGPGGPEATPADAPAPPADVPAADAAAAPSEVAPAAPVEAAPAPEGEAPAAIQ